MSKCVYKTNIEHYINRRNKSYTENNVCEIKERNECEDNSNSI